MILYFIFTLNYLPVGDVYIYSQPLEIEFDNSFYTNLIAGVEWSGFYIQGNVQTYEWQIKDRLSFWSYQANYGIGFGWKNKNIDIGFRHYCIHPVVPYMFFYKPKLNWEAGYEEIFIKLSGEAKIGF